MNEGKDQTKDAQQLHEEALKRMIAERDRLNILLGATLIILSIISLACMLFGSDANHDRKMATSKVLLEECRKEQMPLLGSLVKAVSELTTCEVGGRERPPVPVAECPPVPECPPRVVTLDDAAQAVYDKCRPKFVEAKEASDRAAQEFLAAVEAAKTAGWSQDSSWWLTNQAAVEAFQQLEVAEGHYQSAHHRLIFEVTEPCQQDLFDAIRDSQEYKELDLAQDYGEYNDNYAKMAALGPSWWQRNALECSAYCSNSGSCRIRRPVAPQGNP